MYTIGENEANSFPSFWTLLLQPHSQDLFFVSFLPDLWRRATLETRLLLVFLWVNCLPCRFSSACKTAGPSLMTAFLNVSHLLGRVTWLIKERGKLVLTDDRSTCFVGGGRRNYFPLTTTYPNGRDEKRRLIPQANHGWRVPWGTAPLHCLEFIDITLN